MYIKKTYICGAVIEVHKTVSHRYGRHSPRSPNRKPTTEEQAAINERNAIANLTRILNANFVPGDHHLVLTYRRHLRPDAEQAKKHLRNFTDALRRLYRSSGKELKYVCVTEYKRAAIHHHVVVNYHDLREIQKKWTHGSIHSTPLYPEGEYSVLASYLVKETKNTFRCTECPSGKRWNESRNLIHPKPIVEVIKASTWRKEPRAIKGYIIDKSSVINTISTFGEPSQFYRMIKTAVSRS